MKIIGVIASFAKKESIILPSIISVQLARVIRRELQLNFVL